MSLRIFHIIFVSASVALCLFVSMWFFREHNLPMAVLFLVSAGALVVYGKKVFRKLKEIP